MTTPGHNLFRANVILLLAAIALTLPIHYFGIPGGNDLPQHFRFVYAFYDAVHSGEIYPAWSDDTNFGFGDVGVRFYPPLAYYAVVLFRCFTESWTTAIAAAVCFWFFVGGLGTFLLAGESFSEKASVAAALIFMAMPYHANQIYNAGLFAEFAGLGILPYCFLFVRRTISTGKISNAAALSVAYGLLILAHLPLAIIGSLGLFVYAVALNKNSLVITLLKLASSVMAALAASAFYWVRMVSELSLVKHSGPKFTDSSYDFRLNFLASILYVPSSEYGETSLWFTDLLFAITLAMILPALIVFFLGRDRIKARTLVPLLAVFAVAIFISTPGSVWVWEGVRPLQQIQFPWRFLGLISLVGSVIIAGGIDELPALFKTKLRPVGLIAVGLIVAGLVFTGAQVIRPASYSSRAEFDNRFDRYRSDEGNECWLPVLADRRALPNNEKVSSRSRAVEILEWADTDRSFIVPAGDEEKLRVATFYYPLWNATVNGEKGSVTPDDDGTILIAVPTQRSEVRLFLEEPLYETVAGYVSLFSWILLAVGLIIGGATNLKHRELV